ncbi:MAG: DUF1501 domain-containing protein [Acidobacteria bacterium]|nr:DUF1501 domain-containing protein [Acidobacteriota bacterium]
MRSILDTVLTRREAFRIGGVSLGAYWFLPLVEPLKVRAASTVNPRGTARFCIFVMLDGGQSHVDAWDLKEGKWTPQDFDVREVKPGVKWPMGLYPKLAKQLDHVTLMRSVEAWDSVHGRAQYYIQAAHALNPALQKEIPPVGSIVALEYAARRRRSDTLPPYVAMNVTESQAGLLTSGFLPAAYSPFHIDTSVSLSSYKIEDGARKEFERRWELLKRFDARLRTDSSAAAKAYRDYNDHYEGAFRLVMDPRTTKLFEIAPEDHTRYGSTITGDAAIIARNLVEADAGTHFIFLQQNGWDHHKDIYSQKNHYKHSWELDSALANLIEDLAARRRPDGRTLLDETLVLCMGEFGRTPGDLTTGLMGRDHYQYAFTALTAGGGVKGGQLVGKTDETGSKVVDSGWGVKRSIFMEDIAATVYSAMGIDWTKTIQATPSGREFYYIEPFATQQMIASREISVLFG